MSGFFSGFRKSQNTDYDLLRLVDQRILEPSVIKIRDRHVICDIDKTYLETEFESLVKIARIPFEGAKDKVTVRGASAVLQNYRWGAADLDDDSSGQFPQSLHFVSSSPPQLRSILGQKLALDGLDWTSDTFKNQAYNIKRGRFDQLRQQTAYKSAAILKIIGQLKPGARVLFIGDNAESDAYIYLGIKLLLDGELSVSAYQKYIQLTGVEEHVARPLFSLADRELDCEIVGILIRDLPGSRFCLFDPLTRPVRLFADFLEVALFMSGHGFIESSALMTLVRSFHNRYGLSLARIYSLLQQAEGYFSATPEFCNAASLAKERFLPFLPDSLAKSTIDSKDTSALPLRHKSQCFVGVNGEQKPGEDELLHQAQEWIKLLQAEKKQ